MAVSILHRATGTALAVAGGIGMIWWLVAAATGSVAYDSFMRVATGPIGYIVAIGLTWSFFQHLLSGLRHFVLDTGAGYELKTNKTFATLTMVGSVLLTLLFWGTILVSN